MLNNLTLKNILQKKGGPPQQPWRCLPARPFVSPPSSKESSPTLASKVDQLEGMLKMLREDLKKVNVLRTDCPGCENNMPLIRRAREARETCVGVSLHSFSVHVGGVGSLDLGAFGTHGGRGLHCPIKKTWSLLGKALNFSQASVLT